MTQPAPALLDQGNPLLAPGPSRLDTGIVAGPAGKLGIVTLRTSSSTTTAFMNEAGVRQWAKLLAELADQLGGGAVVQPATAADVAALQQMLPTNGLRRPKG